MKTCGDNTHSLGVAAKIREYKNNIVLKNAKPMQVQKRTYIQNYIIYTETCISEVTKKLYSGCI
jgi:hypothetical protein